jgi:ABC-type multidrug transport system ATPase subunit
MDTIVGGQFKKGISGGEKKRLCIAVEMITNPALLILDEPTSGLDSNKAARVLKVLKRLAQEGCTVVFTIHQPSHLLFSQLDRLIVLNYGETVYQGPANGVANYLQKLGVTVPSTSTVSDFMMMELSDFKKVKTNYETPFNAANYKKYLKKSVRKESEILSS